MADDKNDHVGICTCEHNSKKRLLGLCKECAEIKPYSVFRFGKGGGYFWGPGYTVEADRGKPLYKNESLTEDKKDEP